MKLSNKTYDILKWVALVVIPASATFILTVGKIWTLPYYDNIAATITATGLFLAAIIGVSTQSYRAEHLQDNVDLSDDAILEGEDEEETDNSEE